MTVMVHICEAVRKQVHIVSGIFQVLACVAYTELSRYSAYEDISSVHQFQDFREWLPRTVYALISGILFRISAASFVEGQLFYGIWTEVFVDFPAMSAGNAVYRPYSSIFLE